MTTPTVQAVIPFDAPSLTALDFARMVWLVGEETQRLCLVVPGFRASPTGRRRLLRSADAVPVVAVVNRGRSVVELLSDLVDGVVAVNLSSESTDCSLERVRTLLFDRVKSRYCSQETFVAA